MNHYDIADDVSKTRAKRLARGNVFIQRGLFSTAKEWEEKQAKHTSNIKYLKNLMKKYDENRQVTK